MSTDEARSEDSATPTADSPPPKKSLLNRGRLARLVALFGVLALVLATKTIVLPHVPSDHEIEVRLENTKDVTGLEMRWSTVAASEEVATTSMRFPAGQAPPSVRATAYLPDGTYEVVIAVERGSNVDSTRRRIALDGSARVMIPVR